MILKLIIDSPMAADTIRIPSKIQKEVEALEGKDIRVVVNDEL